MIEPDTIKLLRECDAGIKMGTASIADVLDKVNDTKLKEMLENCKDQHQNLQKELESLLEEFPMPFSFSSLTALFLKLL